MAAPLLLKKKSAKIPAEEDKNPQKCYNYKKPCDDSWYLGSFAGYKRGRIFNLATNHLAEDLTTCAGTGVGPSFPWYLVDRLPVHA
jgi:hypothetical protein